MFTPGQDILTKTSSTVMNDEFTSTCDSGNDLNVYIASLVAETTKLTKEKADALQQIANIQKEHANTKLKYRDSHTRLTQSNEARLGLDQSNHKRIAEKNEVIAMNETLTRKNADLLQIHADLGQESAELKSENARLVCAIQPRDALIVQLRAEVVILKETHAAERKQHEAARAERDYLQKQVEANSQTQRRYSDRERGRASFRSRSPRRSTSPYHRQALFYENNREARYREYSRDRPGHGDGDY